ncbi:MAG: methyltransferase domain-containing protein [Tissierellia bacterium]|nr:methyltransferase domain-containing protein [Tissierellia bacterium]
MKKSWIKEIVLTFVISWICFGSVGILLSKNIVDFDSYLGKGLFLLGGMTPSFMAIYSLYGDYRRNVGDEKKTFLKYFLSYIFGKNRSWTFFFLCSFLLILGFGLSSGFHFKLPFGQILLFFIGSTFLFGGNEEILWRGTLLDSFLRRFSWFSTAIIIGVIWGFWHLPLFYIPEIGYEIPFFFFVLSTIVIGVILTVLKIKGSIFQCMLFHGLLNTGFMSLEISSPIGIILAQVLLISISIYLGKNLKRKSSQTQIWDRVAGIYDYFVNKERPAYEKIGSFIREYPSDVKVLELCSGTGLLTEFLLEYFPDYLVSDFSEDMLMKLKDKFGGEISYKTIDCMDIIVEDNTYDLVIMANALHILPNPEKALEEVGRILKPEGIFIAPTFLREDSLKERLQNYGLKMAGIQTHHPWTYEEYQNYFLGHSWEILRAEKIKGSFPIGYVECKKRRKK